jgi:hypothetical protein
MLDYDLPAKEAAKEYPSSTTLRDIVLSKFHQHFEIAQQFHEVRVAYLSI